MWNGIVPTRFVYKKFVSGDYTKSLQPDANYLLSILKPVYSEEGSSRKRIEESIIDFFQDALLSFEDGRVTGYSSAVAWNYFDELDKASDNQSIPEKGEEVFASETFESPDLCVPGVMQWLTGQRHKPIGSEKFNITVLFDHECLEHNPKP